MWVTAPPQFNNVTEVEAPLEDPREGFTDRSLVVDLGKCHFIRPAAVLWTVIHSGLVHARGVSTKVIGPENPQVDSYLKGLGFYDHLLRLGVESQQGTGKANRPPKTILPLTAFRTEQEVRQLTNQAFKYLGASGFARQPTQRLISWTFSELAINAVQHAASPIGAFGLIQFYQYEGGERFLCAVADGGVGIRKSLERNLEMAGRVTDDLNAIELAMRERISGTDDENRGIGLNSVLEDMMKPDHHLILHSGRGSIEVRNDSRIRAQESVLFPGTLAFASIPTAG